MKNFKLFALAVALVITSFVAKADGPNAARLTREDAIDVYINAMSQGKTQGLNDVIDESAKFRTVRNQKIVSMDKADIMSFVDANAGVVQDCSVNTEVVESNTDMSIVKVDMQYNNFVRSNYVTLTNTGEGWKITDVYSVFK
ncbi:hypothetical protein HH214_08220 [Mucilaginibacter robiniae]|uniref:Nuclear transport factor 2 family protein n=1 Tax=Mucilaginibacter robiniae TaxID=2728022 RepID=A0A7L5DXM8_9SPHI|nr:nuclear transport factor 2 family protein [Mucilaginibacter robiniae]QJD95860.1 hypothetical protein HH214_08220 [Mucilaginibacter robiniae]